MAAGSRQQNMHESMMESRDYLINSRDCETSKGMIMQKMKATDSIQESVLKGLYGLPLTRLMLAPSIKRSEKCLNIYV